MTFIRKFTNICFIVFLAFLFIYTSVFVFLLEKSYGNLNGYFTKIIIFVFLVLLTFGIYYLFSQKWKTGLTINIVLLLILFIGVVLRLAAAIFIPCKPVSDFKTMFDVASMAAKGDYMGFAKDSYLYRFPHLTFYCVTVSMLFRIFGTNVFVVKIANVFMSSLSIFLIYLAGKEMFGKKGGLFAALLYALFPASILYIPIMATENFAIPFFILSLYCLIKAYKSENIKKTLVFSLFCGAAVAAGSLMRNVYPFYLSAFVAAIVVLFKKWYKLTSSVALILSFLFVFNAVSLGLYYSGVTSYKLTSSAEPLSIFLLVGFNYNTHGTYSYEDRDIYDKAGKDFDKADKAAKAILKERIYGSPEKIPALFKDKTLILWTHGTFDSVYWSVENNGFDNDDLIPVLSFISVVFYIMLLLLSVIGAVLYKNKEHIFILALAPLAYQCGLMLIEVQPRYTFSVAFIFVLTAVSGCEALQKIVSHTKGASINERI